MAASVYPDVNLVGSPLAASGPSVGVVRVTEDVFGKVGNEAVRRFTLANSKVTVQVVTLGAIITSIRMPDKDGKDEDIMLGYDTPQGYLSPENPYLGAIVGRVANRIANASFTLDGKEYKLNANVGTTTLHGGVKGWDKAIWSASKHADGVTFSLLSPDGDEGFPGAVLAQVTYRLTEDSRLLVHMQAAATLPTPVNMVNHAYFNLAGHNGGSEGVYKTRLTLNADRYTELDKNLLPTGAFVHVEGTPFDMRSPRLLGDVLRQVDVDHNFIITRGDERPKDTVFVASAYHELSGRVMELYTDQPGVQVYTSNFIPAADKPALMGKQGAKYHRHGAFCLETQNFPDAIHHEGRFPDSVLRPGSLYQHNMVFKFSVRTPQKKL